MSPSEKAALLRGAVARITDALNAIVRADVWALDSQELAQMREVQCVLVERAAFCEYEASPIKLLDKVPLVRHADGESTGLSATIIAVEDHDIVVRVGNTDNLARYDAYSGCGRAEASPYRIAMVDTGRIRRDLGPR